MPGSVHQGTKPFFGRYAYTVTPRYFDDAGSLQPIDDSLGGVAKIEVGPFQKKGLELGFTRGFVQSHYPAPGILPRGRQMNRVALFQQLKRGVPEFQM